jgi:D-3-phosphoglycerate dehydrogenase / 2-oxoglutarate reductase
LRISRGFEVEAANKILIGPSSFGETDASPLERLREQGLVIIDNPFRRKLAKNELIELLGADVVGLLAGLEPLDREVLSSSRLKVVSRVGSGMSNVDQVAAHELGIIVCSTPNGPTESVAELTIGCMLNLIRMVPQMDAALHRGEWTKKIGFLLEGKTVVIAGYGRIGRRVAELLVPFRARTIVVDPFLTRGADEPLEIMALQDALPLADILTMHASGNERILGEDEFGLLKKGAFLLNVARGGLIDEKLLARALRSGAVAGAWLDAFAAEPYSGELSGFPNVILTPHVGSYTAECRRQMETEAVENLIKALQGTENAIPL